MTWVPTHYMQNKTQKSNPEFMQVQTSNSNYLSWLPCSTQVISSNMNHGYEIQDPRYDIIMKVNDFNMCAYLSVCVYFEISRIWPTIIWGQNVKMPPAEVQ